MAIPPPEPKVDETASPTASVEGSNQKKRRLLKRGVLAAIFAVVVLASFFLVTIHLDLNEPLVASSPYWEGGEWSNPLAVNCNPPSIVEFKGKLYMFYSVVTENTIGDDDVVIMPQEHLLYDVFYRVFDGTNFSEPVALSSPTDKVSVTGRYFVFKEELYVVLSEWWISNYTSYETESKVHTEVFDGSSWRKESWPFVEDAYAFHELKYFAYADKLWALWQYMDKPVAGHFSNVFGFRTFDGKVWTETRNFTNPITAPDDWRLTIADDQLWVVWSKSTPFRDPNTHNPHNEVWIGRFDGENWSNVTMVSASDDTGANWGFFLTQYRDELFAFWGGEYFDTSEHGNWVWVMRRLNLTDGSFSELAPITPESGYSPSTAVFDGRLYFLWSSAYQGWKSMINTFNGTQWSSIYHFDRGYDADGLFVYNDKLWALGADESYQLNEVGVTYLRSYSRSG